MRINFIRNAWRDFAEHRQLAGRRRLSDLRVTAALHAIPTMADNPLAQQELVLGYAANYGVPELAPFVVSLRKHYGGEVVLILANASTETRQYLNDYGVRVVLAEASPLLQMAVNSSRMFWYLDHLRGSVFDAYGRTNFARILISDLRDVVFQGSPFQGFRGGIDYFLEANGDTIEECEINRAWVEKAFGFAGVQKLGASAVSCSGTVIATPAAMLSYLRHMCMLLVSTPHAVRWSGMDQAIHNKIVYERLVETPQRIQANGHAVVTVPAPPRPHGLVVRDDGTMANAATGTVSPIIHQYDRHPDLVRAALDSIARVEPPAQRLRA